MPRDYHSSRVDSWFISAQREIFRNTIVDVAYVGNRADGTLLFANFNQARPNAPGENLSLQARRPIPEFARHHLRVERRQVALRRLPGPRRDAAAAASTSSTR